MSMPLPSFAVPCQMWPILGPRVLGYIMKTGRVTKEKQGTGVALRWCTERSRHVHMVQLQKLVLNSKGRFKTLPGQLFLPVQNRSVLLVQWECRTHVPVCSQQLPRQNRPLKQPGLLCHNQVTEAEIIISWFNSILKFQNNLQTLKFAMLPQLPYKLVTRLHFHPTSTAQNFSSQMSSTLTVFTVLLTSILHVYKRTWGSDKMQVTPNRVDESCTRSVASCEHGLLKNRTRFGEHRIKL